MWSSLRGFEWSNVSKKKSISAQATSPPNSDTSVLPTFCVAGSSLKFWEWYRWAASSISFKRDPLRASSVPFTPQRGTRNPTRHWPRPILYSDPGRAGWLLPAGDGHGLRPPGLPPLGRGGGPRRVDMSPRCSPLCVGHFPALVWVLQTSMVGLGG